MKSVKNIAAVVAITTTALLSTAIPTSADNAVPVSGFTPDGVNHIAATSDASNNSSVTVQSYLNSGNFSPDGINSIQDAQITAIAMFTPDGVNQVGQVGTEIVRAQVLAYMNGGDYSPDGVSPLQSSRGQTAEGVSGPAIAMFTPDGVNQVGQVGTEIVRAQVLAYMNGGDYSPDGVSNVQNNPVGLSGFTDVVIHYADNPNAASIG